MTTEVAGLCEVEVAVTIGAALSSLALCWWDPLPPALSHVPGLDSKLALPRLSAAAATFQLFLLEIDFRRI